MKIGAWIHSNDDVPLESQIALAAQYGLQTIRSYHLGYAERAKTALQETGLSLLGGLAVDAQALVDDWRSQLRLDELARYHELGIPLEAICVGNELREGGDAPGEKRFTARLSFGLTNLLVSYRDWLDTHGLDTPLTYAMEGIVMDDAGQFFEWVTPLIDACDIVAVNLYPMGAEAWFTFAAFAESQRFLYDARVRHLRLTAFEMRLRRILERLAQADKPLILSETGFPSATGYQREGERLIVPESDNDRFGELMVQFVNRIRQVNVDYQRRIQALYVYEWRDNLHHSKIWNVEQSPIHVAFGLCDRLGAPKFDIQALTAE